MTNGKWTTNPHDPVDGFYEGDSRGLTKREYFAATALSGLLTNAGLAGFSHEQMVANAVEFADALIDALNAKNEVGYE